MKKLFDAFKKDYRHIICSSFTLMSAASGHFFPNALPRLAESLRDLATSIVYYFAEIFFTSSNTVYPTVVKLPEWQFGNQIWKPITILPATLEEFLLFWGEYWKQVFNIECFTAYLKLISNMMDFLARFLMLLVPLLVIVLFELNNLKNENCTTRNKKSVALKWFELFLFDVIYPVIYWIRSFVRFCTRNRIYPLLWIIIWGLHFNVFSILLSFLAYYLYFTASWELNSIYRQLLKLQIDITPVVRFIPGLMWFVIAYCIIDRIARNIAKDRIHYFKRANMNFLRGRGISTIFDGKMGMGKTKLMTGVGLLRQEMIFDDMYDVMFKYDHYFPNFPWINLIDDLRERIDNREICDLFQARAFAQKLRNRFIYIMSKYDIDEHHYFSFKYPELNSPLLYGYDFDHYPLEYDNGLRIIDIFDAIEEYACAYYTFTVDTNLLFANYSIRSDSILLDKGNMPYRDNSMFGRDPYERERYSNYAHIIEMDMLRLGRKMVENNERARTLLPGIYIQSEKDKERKNTLELKEIKANSDEANQKNDLANATEMMSRHANTVDFKPLTYHLADLQRSDALGAGSRQLAELVTIVDKTPMTPVLPFFSPFWIYETVYLLFKSVYKGFIRTFVINRSDQILFCYLIKNLYSAMTNYYEKLVNTYGVQTLTLHITNGENVTVDYWRSISIFELSDRYSTDCLKGVFEPAVPNEMHIDDYEMYEGIIATPEELGKQHSYFQNDIKKMKGQ